MPVRQYVLLNRTVIKVTHLPILFTIFLYEKYFLANSMYEPTDLVDNHGRGKQGTISFADPVNRGNLFSPNVRAREESVVGMQKDRALDEVFRRPPDASTIRNQRRQERKDTLVAIRSWMDQHDDVSGAPLSRWPTLGTLDGGAGMSLHRRSMSRDFPQRFRQVSDVRSAASDPADLFSNNGLPLGGSLIRPNPVGEQQQPYKDQTDADGDDELMTNDEDEEEADTTVSHRESTSRGTDHEHDSTTPVASRRETMDPASPSSSSNRQATATSPRATGQPRRSGLHSRTLSTNTILYAPQESSRRGPSPPSTTEERPATRPRPRVSRLYTTVEQSAPTGTRSPRRIQYVSTPTQPQSIPSRSAPNRATLSPALIPARKPRPLRRPSSVEVDAASEMGPEAAHDFGAISSSFATQMAMATGQFKGLSRGSQDRETTERLNRLVLAKMKTLEEGFADVVKEMRVMRSAVPSPQHSGDDTGSWGRRAPITQGPRSDKSKSGGRKHVSQPGSAVGPSPASSKRGGARKRRDKGKAREPAVSETASSESEEVARRTRRRGSSF